MLFAEDKESTVTTASETTGSSISSHTDPTTHSKINTFFIEDLSHLLQSL
jgi:hypothetical protein